MYVLWLKWLNQKHLAFLHLQNQPLQLVCEFAEVAGGDESQPALLQTVTGQFNYLVVSKAEHAICQREDALWRAAADDLLNLLLHLSCGLQHRERCDFSDARDN